MPNQNLTITFEAIDKITGPLKGLTSSFKSSDKVIQSHHKTLSSLKSTSKTIAQYEKLQSKIHQTSNSLVAAQDKVKKLTQTFHSANKQPKNLSANLAKAHKAVNQLQASHIKQRKNLGELNRSLKQAGVNTRNLTQAKSVLTQQESRLNTVLERQYQQSARLQRAQVRKAQLLRTAGKFSLAGGAAMGMAWGLKNRFNVLLRDVMRLEQAKGELASLGFNDLDVVVKRAEAMSRQIAGVTADSFVRAAYDIRSGISGLSESGVADMTAMAAITAKATKANVETMTSLFATGYGVYKQQFKDLTDGEFGEQFSAGIAKSVQQFKTTGSAMQQAIQSLGGGATNAGMSYADQMATLGKLQTTMEASIAGTSLRAFVQNIVKAQTAFNKLAREGDNPIHVRLIDDKGMMKSMPDILSDIKKRYGELNTLDKAEISQAFGSEIALKVIDALIKQTSQLRSDQQAIRQAMREGLKFTEQMAARADDNFASRAQLLNQKLGLLKEQIGYTLVPALEQLFQQISPIIAKMANWITNNKDLVATLGKFVLILGTIAVVAAPVLLTLGAMTAGFALLTGSLPKVIMSLSALSRFLLLNPIGLTITGIATAALLIYKYWQPLKDFFAQLWQGVSQVFQSALSFMKRALSYSPLALIKQAWQPIKTFLVNFWQEMVGHISHAMQKVTDTLMAPLRFAQQHVGKAWDKIVGKSKPIVDKLEPSITPVRAVLAKAENPHQSSSTQTTQKQSLNIQQTTAPNITMPVTIYTQPNQNPESIAEHIKQQLRDLLQDYGANHRSHLFDSL